MTESLSEVLKKLDIENCNGDNCDIGELRKLRKKLKGIIKTVAAEQNLISTAKYIITQYPGDGPVGSFKCLAHEVWEEDCDTRNENIFAEFAHTKHEEDEEGVYICYSMTEYRTRNEKWREGSGLTITPTEEENPELYDDFLRWLDSKGNDLWTYLN